MSKAIEFLESLGCSPALAQPSLAAYVDVVAALGVDERKRAALLDRDVQRLSGLLGGRAMMAMNVATPDGGDEPLDRPERRDDEQSETEQEPKERNRPN
jgi:hypothetical protein